MNLGVGVGVGVYSPIYIALLMQQWGWPCYDLLMGREGW